MEEVVQDSAWLDKRWQEKDRLLSHFTRHQSFLDRRRNSARLREFNTKSFAWERSVVSMIRLLILPFSIPILVLISIPVLWTLLLGWAVNSVIEMWQKTNNQSLGDGSEHNDILGDATNQTEPVTPASVNTTPFIPATPFGSPASLMPWFSKRSEPPKS
jgi:hypothetical protein